MRLFIFLFSVVFLLFIIALTVGSAQISPVDSIGALFINDAGPLSIVVREIRLPRAILAIMIGGGLGLSGAALQSYLRNPLAEPGLIGISSSAALGAVFALYTGLAAASSYGLLAMALLGALLGVLCLLVLAGSQRGSLTLILAGIAISAMAAALTSLVLNLSSNPFAASEIVFWMMGSIADRSMLHVMLIIPFIAIGSGIIIFIARGLDALTLGEDVAETMGFRLAHMQILLVLGVASIVGGITAVAGAIGFIGLVVPHILRPFVSAQPSRLLWASALGGAAMLQLADIMVQVVFPQRDLKLGVVTALVGVPFFLHLIYKTRKEMI